MSERIILNAIGYCPVSVLPYHYSIPSCKSQIPHQSVSTEFGVPGGGGGFEVALKPSKQQKGGRNPGKRHFHFFAPNSSMHETLLH